MSAWGQDDVFERAETMDEIQERMRLVPADDIWWTVRGEQMGWMHRNPQQLFPTVNVYRAGPVSELDYALNDAIDNFSVDTPDGPMRFADFIASEHSTTLGMVVLHKGKIVFEAYPRMQNYEKPIYWSVAKVLPATTLRIFEERGMLDVSKPVKFYIPELEGSPFADITVRNVLDMATGLDCQDEYEDRESCYYQYSMAIGDGHRDADAPDNPYDFLKTLEVSKHAEQGQQYSYSGVSTFVLGWIAEKITGQPFNEIFTEEIWRHIGAESDAAYVAYRYAIPLTHGGFLSNMRDLARFGLLFTPSYSIVSDSRIISDSHLALLSSPGNPNLRTEDGIQSIYQWIVYPNGDLNKGGWGGQAIIINPERDLVTVYASFFKEDFSEVQLDNVVPGMLDAVFDEQR